MLHTDHLSPAVTSIYLDDGDFSLYHERISKEEGAQAIRIRYYGQEPSASEPVFIERKTHHEKWTGLESVKIRFSIKKKHVQALLEGRCDVEKAFQKRAESAVLKGDEAALKEVEKAKQLAIEVQDTIKQRSLRPMIRTSYNRTAFQVPGDARFRISLDTDLRIAKEGNDGTEQVGQRLKSEDVCVFPYAVLEIKIQTHEGVETPEWVTRLVESELVRRHSTLT